MVRFLRRSHFWLLLVALLLGTILSSLTEDYLRGQFTTLILQARGIEPPALEDEKEALFDENGIPLHYVAGKPYYDPVYIAHQARQLDDEHFIKVADWFVENAVEREGGFLVWESNWSIPAAKAPWISCLGQNLVILALMRADKLTGNPIYLETAQRALGAFTHDTANGGIRIVEENGGWWYEHFASPHTPPSRTLNAMAWSLVGLSAYYEYSQDPLAKELFERGMIALKTHLPEYDAGVWSYYDPGPPLATDEYHHQNIHSLAALYNITKEPIILEYSQRFQSYSDNHWAWVQRELIVERPFILRRFYDASPEEIDWLILCSTIGGVFGFLELGAMCFQRIRNP